MKSKLKRLLLAAPVVFACMFSTAFADGLLYRTCLLTWTPPTENDDGSPVDELLGYYIYTGPAPDRLVLTYFMGAYNPSIAMRVPAVGARYFAVSAITVDGNESDLTEILSDSTE